MKKLYCGILAVGICLGSSAAFAADFTNGGFETGDFTGWTKDGGTNGGRGWGGGNPPMGITFSGDPGKSAIVSAGFDPYTGGVLPMVFDGKYSARVNNYDSGWHMSTITQSVANWTANHMYFAWAAVLQDPGHPSSLPTWDEQPFFHLSLVDKTTNASLYDIFFDATTMQSMPGLVVHNGVGNWLYTDWNTVDLDTSKVAGDTLELTLMAADCGQGGHGGYAYLDGFGKVIPHTPEPATMLLFGTGLAGLAAARRRRSSK